MATIRVFLLVPSAGSDAIVATIRDALGEIDERRPSRHEVLLDSPVRRARPMVQRLVTALDRYHPQWRSLILLSAVERRPS